ncbi:trypsin-like peptidase domain-containing protein [Mameliella alba]|uniref:Putative Periplasmic serine proteinase n=1 Tax=Mameliella alba TaxID=561184 RepID=A0A0B3S6H7_9RHOB|nr:trypsin-like peptidase domain-containing protein [Mameliella alba]KHQ54568.1 putative Periplasmic serine proteinase [Mameliella alba]
MTANTNPQAPAWWTILRAAVIFASGLLIAVMIAPRFLSQPPDLPRQSSDPSVLSSLLAFEQGVGQRLQSRVAEAERRLSGFQCTIDQASPNTGPAPTVFAGRPDMSRLRAVADGAVVFIQAGEGSGTGFFVTPRHVATNAHVVGAEVDVLVYSETLFPTPVRGRVTARTVKRGEGLAERDYAIVEVEGAQGVQPLQFMNRVTELDPVVSVGFPGLFQSFQQTGLPRMIFRAGEFIDALPQADGREVFAHSAEVLQGNSGGPLINACGQVIGMNTFIIWANPSGEGASPKVKTDFALPSADLADYLASEGVTVTTAQTCEP